MSYRHPTLFRQRFPPVRHQSSYHSYDYDECDDENQPPSYPAPAFQNADRPEVTNSSFPPRKSFIDTIVTRNDEYWNRVTLKLDVPFTDHSHIIGRGGKNTQAVMKQTACHIHFPDSNKNHDSDKSNQVSIAGPIGKVEIARSRIRGLAPLSISFELKGMLPSVKVDQLVADACLEKTLGFAELNIVVRTNRASGQPYCLVRGSAHQMDMMIEACEALRRFFFPPDMTVSYSTSLEVLPGQQTSVIGRNGRHIDWIAQKTGATVHFPSASDCQRGASTFYIAGSIKSILDARKYILGLLPVQLTFEVRKGNAKAVQPDPVMIEQLLGVALTVKYRPNGGDQGAKAVTVRSCEYNLTNVYAVRSHLVEPTDDAVLCADYEFMRDMRAVIELPTAQASSPNRAEAAQCFQPPMPSLAQSHLSSPHPLLFPGFNQFLLQQSGCNMPMHQITTASYMQQQMGLPPPTPTMLMSAQQQYSQHSSQYPVQPQLYRSSVVQPQQHSSLPLKQWLLSDLGRADGQSTGLGSSASAERSTSPDMDSPTPIDDRQATVVNAMKNVMLAGERMTNEPPTTPKTTAISPNPEESPLAHSVLAAAKKFNSAQNGSLWKAPGIERRPLGPDIDQLRMQATLAMHESPTHGGVRTPTEQWSGMLFSNSAPTAALKAKYMFDQPPLRARFRGSNDDEGGMADTSTVTTNTLPSVLEDGYGEENDSPASAFFAVPPRSINCATAIRRPTEFAATSYWDSASLQSPYMNIDWDIRKFRDPSMVLAALGLSDHHGRFRDEEIDMDAFLSLDEENLKELGVSTIGARTKLRIAIMKLNESNAMYGQQ